MTASQNQFTCYTLTRMLQSGIVTIFPLNDKSKDVADGEKQQAKPKTITGTQTLTMGAFSIKNINHSADKVTSQA